MPVFAHAVVDSDDATRGMLWCYAGKNGMDETGQSQPKQAKTIGHAVTEMVPITHATVVQVLFRGNHACIYAGSSPVDQ